MAYPTHPQGQPCPCINDTYNGECQVIKFVIIDGSNEEFEQRNKKRRQSDVGEVDINQRPEVVLEA